MVLPNCTVTNGKVAKRRNTQYNARLTAYEQLGCKSHCCAFCINTCYLPRKLELIQSNAHNKAYPWFIVINPVVFISVQKIVNPNCNAETCKIRL